MLMQSGTARTIIIIFLAGMFGLTSTSLADKSVAGRQGRKAGPVVRGKHYDNRLYARDRGKRVIRSPRVSRQGHFVSRLPRGYRRVWHRREPYYYYGGAYYRPSGSGFIVISPPLGIVVSTLPVGYQRVWISGGAYYTYGGVLYRRAYSGYVVVDPPPAVYLEDDVPVMVEPAEPAEGLVSVKATVLNVRAGPGLTYPVIYQIQKGYILEVHGRATGWLYVQLPNGEFGWVMNIYTDWLESPGSG